MLHVATTLWAPNIHSHPFSRYDESWVEKLYRGFKRNLPQPFRFVCFVDTERRFGEPAIEQELMLTKDMDYGAQAEVYRLGAPTIFAQLDSVIVGNCDLFADYCLTQKDIALSRDPYVSPPRALNGVAFIPIGHQHVFADWRGETDLTWMRRQQQTAFIEDIWPNRPLVLSYKAQVEKVSNGKLPPDTRIVYMHGRPKQSDLMHLPWVKQHWR